MTTQLANLLTRMPINQWESKLKEFENAANSNPGYTSEISKMINNAKKAAMQNIRYQDPQYYDRIVKDPKYKDFSSKLA